MAGRARPAPPNELRATSAGLPDPRPGGGRGRLFAALGATDGIHVCPSGANFLLFRVAGDAHELWKRLLARGVLVRDFSSWPRIEGCLRVTVGTPGENDAFLAALDEALPEVVT